MKNLDIESVRKPWGRFTRYALNQKCTVKIITVEKGQSTSLQSHKNRDELWVALDEGIRAELGSRVIPMVPGESITIPRGSKHRLSSIRGGARVLEVSFGDFDEEDIIRYVDKYGRAERG